MSSLPRRQETHRLERSDAFKKICFRARENTRAQTHQSLQLAPKKSGSIHKTRPQSIASALYHSGAALTMRPKIVKKFRKFTAAKPAPPPKFFALSRRLWKDWLSKNFSPSPSPAPIFLPQKQTKFPLWTPRRI